MADLTRKTINITERAIEALNRISENTGYNETDTINRALVLNATLMEYMENGTFTILAPDGERIRLILI